MSLINQMLKDLEQRRSPVVGELQGVMLDVQAVPEPEHSNRRHGILLLGAMLLLVLGGLGWWSFHVRQPIPVRPVATAPENREIGENNVSGNSQVSRITATPAAPAAINTAAIMATAAPPVISPPEVTAPTVPAAKVPTPIMAARTSPPAAMTKVDHLLDRREQVEAAFQQGMAAQRAGRPETMELFLRQVLMLEPDHLPARETLAAFFYRAGRLDQARELLNGGITPTLSPLSLRKILARIQVDQNDPAGAALTLLQDDTPLVAQDPEFHQLLAAIYQRIGQFDAAARIYRQLLELQPRSGVWWLGLGLALESSRAWPEAVHAYRTALDDPTLPPGLNVFAQDRFKSLAATTGIQDK
ncbi:MAG TPA: tetratricopeptide repeat protein [Desulfurivibrionaceae bacterium]|nr:tetratricopeptide repeat protein [Desulfurivibrionaceae bacterium]